jgi:uroporphyrinogen-III synthase
LKVLLIRANRNGEDAVELSRFGLDALIAPYLQISQVDNLPGAEKMLEALVNPGPKWFVLTSTNALSYWSELVGLDRILQTFRNPEISFAAIGEQTAAQLKNLGVKDVLVPSQMDSLGLAELMRDGKPCPVIIPSGSIAMKSLPDELTKVGFEIISEVVYATEGLKESPIASEQLVSGEIAAVLFRSPSAARAFISFHPEPKIKLVCGGNTTARQLRTLGFEPDAISEDPSPAACAKTISDLLGVKK